MMRDISAEFRLERTEHRMRITKEQAEANRRKIIETAATLFMKHGFNGVGIAEIMKTAGFTHGGFYNHFKSKQDLEGEATAAAFDLRPKLMKRPDSLRQYLESYLSERHVKWPERGCPVAAMGADVPRESEPVRKSFADGVEDMLTMLESHLADEGAPETGRRERAGAILSEIVGAVVLARAIPESDPLRDDLLKSTLQRALALALAD